LNARLFAPTCALLAITASGSSTNAAESDPSELVKSTIAAVMLVLQDESIDQGEKRHRVMSLASPHIDFTGMSQRVLARNWSNATLEQRQRFIELFRQYLLNTF